MHTDSTVDQIPATLTPCDDELIAGILCGDELAWQTLYNRYYRLAAHLAYRITWNTTTAEEVVQDTFQSVWQSAVHFQSGQSFRAWFTAIACHRAVDTIRTKAFHKREREEFLGDARVAASLDAVAGPEQTLVQREGLRAAMRELSPLQRRAITLMYYEGLTTEEIATLLNKPLGTVKSRLRLGVIRMRELLVGDSDPREQTDRRDSETTVPQAAIYA